MTEEQLSVFRKMLEQKREALMETKTVSDDAAKPVELDQSSVGRLSRMDAMQQQSMDLAREQRRQQRLDILAAALHRVDADDYGYCLKCDEPIKEARLKIDPAVTTCVSCAR